MDCNDADSGRSILDDQGCIKLVIRYKPSRALVEYSIPTASHLPPQIKVQLIDEIYQYLDQAFLLMPWSLAIPLWHVQKLFQLSAFFSCGQPFSHQSQPQREVFVRRWCQWGRPFEALIRLYRSFVMLSYFEHPLVRDRS